MESDGVCPLAKRFTGVPETETRPRTIISALTERTPMGRSSKIAVRVFNGPDYLTTPILPNLVFETTR